jgi:glycosyltransferase involved in cell wall biosynthesis/GT2 family glycosyltransferase
MGALAALAAAAARPAIARGGSIVTLIDVIVPVYRGAAPVRRCIESVLRAQQAETRYELIAVDDASPESDLAHWLRGERDRGRLTLLQQPSSDGFATTINRALALHPDRDVVVLRGDGEVAGDWLDRLAAHAGKGRDIGTVMPFSNDGGVAGYPKAAGSESLPDAHTVASLDLLFRRANAGHSLPVPFVRGCCVYLRRECLTSLGACDGSAGGNADSVVQEFGLRASAAGFRHLLAGDVFVRREGEVAFATDETRESIARAMETLDRRYPQAAAQRAEFIATDPSRPFRRRVDLLRLAESPKQVIVFVALAWGGGIRRHMTELAKMIGERCNVLLLEPAEKETVKLSWFEAAEDFSAWFSLPDEMEALASLLRGLGAARIHIHHIHALPRSVLELPRLVGIPYDCTLHDYYAICPQYHLVTEEGRYCGEPDAAGCAACLAKRPGQWDMDIVSWRGVFGQLLRGAERIIAPSRDVARRIGRYFPDVNVSVLAHPEEPAPAIPQFVRVATLGSLSPEKGLNVLAACAKDARARALPLSFRVLGPTTEPVSQWPQAALSIHGQYPDGELPQLLAAEGPDVIWFPAQVPETYSYTLSVAMTTGLPIVASDLGALPERLANYPHAVIVPWNAPAERWNDILCNVVRREHAEGRPAPVRIARS